MNKRNSQEAPAWMLKLFLPFMARNVAREMIKKYPHLSADAILDKMRAEAGSMDANGEKILQAVARYLPASPSRTPREPSSKSIYWYSPSSLFLIAANLVPLYGVLELHWPVFPMLLLFWLENVVIGVLNVTRMFLVDPRDLILWASKLFMIPFFCVHYGMFTAVHGMFVIHLFGGKAYDKIDQGFIPYQGTLHAIVEYQLFWAVLILAASHLFSLLWNYVIKGEYRRASLMNLMQRPYKRIVILHLTIILGGAVTAALGSPLWALILLIALKIAFDLKAHIKEHVNAANPPAAQKAHA